MAMVRRCSCAWTPASRSRCPPATSTSETFNKYRERRARCQSPECRRQGAPGNIWTQAGAEAPVRGDPGRRLPAQHRPPRRAVPLDAQQLRQRDHRRRLSRRPADFGHHHAERLTDEIIAGIQRAASQGGFIGTLVSRDQTSAMIVGRADRVRREGKPSSTTSPTTACSSSASAPSSRTPTSRSRSSASPSRSATSPTALRGARSSAHRAAADGSRPCTGTATRCASRCCRSSAR
jgi:hypothetical protein